MAIQIFAKIGAQVLAARSRRAGARLRGEAKIDWFINNVSNKVNLTMEKRVGLATELVKSQTVKNISRPVTKAAGPRGGRVILNRSKPGEFPKADTTQLMKSIFARIEKRKGVTDGFVGTPLDYGLILETKMNRSFLRRTLLEEQHRVKKILTGPIR